MGGSDDADCLGDGDLIRVIPTESEPIAKLLSRANQIYSEDLKKKHVTVNFCLRFSVLLFSYL